MAIREEQYVYMKMLSALGSTAFGMAFRGMRVQGEGFSLRAFGCTGAMFEKVCQVLGVGAFSGFGPWGLGFRV